MVAGADDKIVKDGPTRPTTLYRQQQIDHGKGDMVSENRAANARFERNSAALQQRQAEKDKAHVEGQDKPKEQGEKKDLSFGAGRQQRNYNELKQDHANGVDKDQAEQPGEKKQLSFGPGRQGNDKSTDRSQSSEQDKGQGQSQQQDDKKGLSFGPGRDQGQEQNQEKDQGHGR